jgi:hypothetical protein
MANKYSIEDAPAPTAAKYTVEDATDSGGQPAPPGVLRASTDAERFNTTYPVGVKGQSARSNIKNTAQDVGVGMYKTINHPINTVASLLSALIPQPVLDWSAKKNKEFQDKFGVPAPKLAPDDEAMNAPNPVKSTFDAANTRDVAGAAQAAGSAIVMGGAGEFKGLKGLAPRSAESLAKRRASSLASTLARTPMNADKGFIPQDIASAIAEPVRQAAAEHPELAQVATGSDPVQAFAAHQAILNEAEKSMEKEFNSILDPVRGHEVDARLVTHDLYASDALKQAFPQEANWVNEFYARLDGVRTLGDLNEMRRLLNDKAASTYKSAAATMEESGRVGAVRKAADTLRDYFYKELEQATGKDLRTLKRTEGSLIDAKTAAKSSGPRLTAEHQIHTERRSTLRTAADIAKGSKAIAGGAIPIVGWAADKLEGSQLQQLHSYLKDFYSDLPQVTLAGAPAAGGPTVRVGNVPNPPEPRAPGLPPFRGATVPVEGPMFPTPTGITHEPRAGNSTEGATENALGGPRLAPRLTGGGAPQLEAGGTPAGPDKTFQPAAKTQVGPTNLESATSRPAPGAAGQSYTVDPNGQIRIQRKLLQAPTKKGDVITFQGKQMRVAKVFPDGQIALQEIKPPKPVKGAGPAPKKGSTPAQVPPPAAPVKTPAQMTDEWASNRHAPPAPPPEGRLTEMNVAEISQDPERFQYKGNTDPTGVTDKLKDVQWDPDLSGVISVWKDPADGKTYVVNGHHRLQKAIESNVGKVDVKFIDAKDAAEARAKGALQNIAEGNGTAVDAAKFFRESGLNPEQLKKRGISLSKGLGSKGVSLSKLSDDLFDQVVSGKMDEDRGAAIGKATSDPLQQESLVKLIQQEEARGKTLRRDRD